MRPRIAVALLAAALGLTLTLGAVVGVVVAQSAKGNFPVQLRGGPTAQNTLKVDNSVTPARTNFGCEKDQEGGASQPVNGLRIVGAIAGSGPIIQTVPCTGGDAAIPLQMNFQGAPSPGPLGINADTTDFVVFFAATEACTDDNLTNLKPTRLAQGDWALARTAAGAETYSIACHFQLPFRTTAGKGVKITAFSISQQITVVALTSNTFNGLNTVTYANNVSNAVAAYGGTITITMPTATQANPYLTAATVGTPAYMNTASAVVDLDFTVVLANTGVYRFYGIYITFSTQLY